jgi:hypothetical protein
MNTPFRILIASLVIATTACGGAAAPAGPSAPAVTPSATPVATPVATVNCTAAVAATFAWWIGAWDYTVPGFDPGVTTVTPGSGGCALQEEFVDVHGRQSHTTIQFDETTQKWRRSVTDPFRTYLSTGVFAPDGSIAFYETPTDRESYRPTDATHVRFFGETSTDGGVTWRLLFDATDTRRP